MRIEGKVNTIIDNKLRIEEIRDQIIGINAEVKLLNGDIHQYVNFDNAASTPSFKVVWEKITELLNYYSAVHRGTGYKSLISTEAYEEARNIIRDFVGADEENDCVVFTGNTTDSINKLVSILHLEPDDIVITSMIEHHSNDLPWRRKVNLVRLNMLPDGNLDLDDLTNKLNKYGNKVKLVTLSGASNVTGLMPPIYQIAEIVHKFGSKLLVDCAQLIAHRRIKMGKVGSPQRLDFIVFSGHKMYAPYGSGALIGAKKDFSRNAPLFRGGGTIELVTLNDIIWAEPPDLLEAGSPNVLGAVAIGAACKILSKINLDSIAKHEFELTKYAISELVKLKGVRLYGPTKSLEINKKVGVISFDIENLPCGIVAAILGYEGAIGVRHGCFCAHPYVTQLLNVPPSEIIRLTDRVRKSDKSQVPGLVRVSLSCYNSEEEVDHLINVLKTIIDSKYYGKYQVDTHTGVYYPIGYDRNELSSYFTLSNI